MGLGDPIEELGEDMFIKMIVARTTGSCGSREVFQAFFLGRW